MNPREAIIVLQHFNNPIDATIIQAKLEAHGIPCFLTEEHMTSLYGNAQLTGGVRLHVLAADEQRARDVVQDRELLVEPPDHTCPRCQSVQVVERITRKKLVLGLFSTYQRVRVCQACGFEF